MHQFNALNGDMCNIDHNGVAVEAFMNAIKQFIGSHYKRRIIEQRSLNALQFLNGVELVWWKLVWCTLDKCTLLYNKAAMPDLHISNCPGEQVHCLPQADTHTQSKHGVVQEHNSLCSVLQ